ncbi:hypothetical protein FPQ18DRAFT_419354 [Pyronema domesticum]|nr:hypothetical protein FPQ18DRAFT_419354 [Pyronema domesticum]
MALQKETDQQSRGHVRRPVGVLCEVGDFATLQAAAMNSTSGDSRPTSTSPVHQSMQYGRAHRSPESVHCLTAAHKQQQTAGVLVGDCRTLSPWRLASPREVFGGEVQSCATILKESATRNCPASGQPRIGSEPNGDLGKSTVNASSTHQSATTPSKPRITVCSVRTSHVSSGYYGIFKTKPSQPVDVTVHKASPMQQYRTVAYVTVSLGSTCCPSPFFVVRRRLREFYR